MAGMIRIVTDSSAQFVDPTFVERYGITVVPLDIRLESHVYREGVDVSPDGFLRRLAHTRATPTLLPPTIETFEKVYTKLNRETDRIISLHLSRAIHSTWQHAKAATERLLGRCEIAVVDSQLASVGLALLVETAARLADQTDSVDEVVREVRKMIPRFYSIFSVETLDYLLRAKLVSESHAALGAMLGIKPFLTIEEGELIVMEKTRTRLQTIDKLVEFVTEFASIEQLVILQNGYSEQIRTLQDRIAVEFSRTPFPTITYSPSLACILGPDATGIMILENDLETDDDYDLYE